MEDQLVVVKQPTGLLLFGTNFLCSIYSTLWAERRLNVEFEIAHS